MEYLYYVIKIIGGASLGMLLTIGVKSVYIQISRKYDLNFWDALKVYTSKHTGPILIGSVVVLIAVFVFPDILRNSRLESGEYGEQIKKVIDWLRVYSVILGVISQGLGFAIVRKSEQKYLRDYEGQKKE